MQWSQVVPSMFALQLHCPVEFPQLIPMEPLALQPQAKVQFCEFKHIGNCLNQFTCTIGMEFKSILAFLTLSSMNIGFAITLSIRLVADQAG